MRADFNGYMIHKEQTSPHSFDTEGNQWYESWFDTPYYHILYKDRDYQEAQLFMDNLTAYLNLPDCAKILDLACGRGRHASYLNKLGFDVTGADLSVNSINEAAALSNDTLRFVVHDMRLPFFEKFDAVFNLFTSFGYFNNEQDNLSTLRAISNSLSDTGFGVIDFMNVNHVRENLVPEETKLIDGIEFQIKRHATNEHIIKDIRFTADKRDFHFTERVRALTLTDFELMMEQAGIYLLDVFGDYKLRKFTPASERLILIFK